MPDVSVFIPVFNDENTIGNAVHSALNQTLENIEVVVVDDGSTDRTPEILAQFDDPRLRVHRQENGGVVIAGNAAARLTKAPLLARLDGDDEIAPNRLERQASYLKNNPDLLLCGCGWTVRVDGKTVERTIPPEQDADLRWRMLWNVPFPNSSIMIRREAFEGVGGYDEGFHYNYPYACDYDLIERVSREGPIGCVQEQLLHWTYDAVGGLSANNRADQRNTVVQVGSRQLLRLAPSLTREEVFAAWRIMNDPKRLESGQGIVGCRALVAVARAFLRSYPEAEAHVSDTLRERGRVLQQFKLAGRPQAEIRRVGLAVQRYADTGAFREPRKPFLRRVHQRVGTLLP